MLTSLHRPYKKLVLLITGCFCPLFEFLVFCIFLTLHLLHCFYTLLLLLACWVSTCCSCVQAKEVVPDPALGRKLNWLTNHSSSETPSSMELTYITDFFLALAICNSVVVSSPNQPRHVVSKQHIKDVFPTFVLIYNEMTYMVLLEQFALLSVLTSLFKYSA